MATGLDNLFIFIGLNADLSADRRDNELMILSIRSPSCEAHHARLADTMRSRNSGYRPHGVVQTSLAHYFAGHRPA